MLGFFSSNLLTQDELLDDKPKSLALLNQSGSEYIDQNNNWAKETTRAKIIDSIDVTVSPNFRPWPGDTVTQTEFSIDVHPSDENIILFSANATDWPYTRLFGSGVYWSLDGGTTWVGHDYPPFDTTETDPASVIDINGNFYTNFMDCSPNSSGQGMAVSTNNGACWERDTVASAPLAGGAGFLDKNPRFFLQAPLQMLQYDMLN